MFFKYLHRAIAAAFLLFTTFSILATSSGDGSPAYGTYHVISDCVSPVKDMTVSISAGSITTGGVSLTDFGFPTTTLSREVSGTVGAVTRSCRVTYGDTTNGILSKNAVTIYSCFDDGSFKCTVYFKE